VNVYGMRQRPRMDPETGSEIVTPPSTPGAIRLWRHVDRSRAGQPDGLRCVLTLAHAEVPGRTSETFYPLMGPGNVPLAVDPRRDVWSAPDWIEFIDLVVTVNADTLAPERSQSIRPRPESWVPEVVA